jgi:hypothetical protein
MVLSVRTAPWPSWRPPPSGFGATVPVSSAVERQKPPPCEATTLVMVGRSCGVTGSMSWHLRFWRRVRVAPGLSVNLSRSGPSVSFGPRGAKLTVGRRGIRRTVGVPGTGVSATNQQSWASLRSNGDDEPGLRASPLRQAPTMQPIAANHVSARPDLEPCGFCGGEVSADGLCRMCGQPVERWRNT